MKIVTTTELAEILKVHPETVRRWVKNGGVPAIKVGARDYRFNVDEVLAALSAKK